MLLGAAIQSDPSREKNITHYIIGTYPVPFILTMAAHTLTRMKNDSVGGHGYSLNRVSSYEREVCSRYTSALCSPSRLSLGTAQVRRGFITKDASVCSL